MLVKVIAIVIVQLVASIAADPRQHPKDYYPETCKEGQQRCDWSGEYIEMCHRLKKHRYGWWRIGKCESGDCRENNGPHCSNIRWF
ncbi:hypothetical protein BDV95DRAFT_569137 [Massariosphaeria phaeospora]|uniref:Uncharacterized protein n=1 Tax=Massariosphaeria phaeospora TaxID=100035 RepID=A0A7C8M803_9PLEO|nr:hypothetical protein BDV95DRAFT_569137 [Massariosphaeria phaeospora]